MMTDEERVARAICYANCLAAHLGDIERATCQADNGWDMWLAEARAAIAAMKEPTDPGIPIYRFPDGTDEALRQSNP
jgi:hypothetical protein